MMSGYDRIPDNDSGTQLISRGYRKLIAGFFCLFIVTGIIFSFLMTYYHDNPPRSDQVLIYQTSQDHGDHLKLMSTADFEERGFNLVESAFREDYSNKYQINFGDLPSADISFDPQVTYQSIIGFGGAFTEASAYNFFKLPVPQRDKFLEAYFGENGIGYSVGRIHINSCDFSLGTYSFDEVEGDYELEHFDYEVLHDTHQIIPFILAAMKKSKKPIQLLASPWSPPSWMKVPVFENNKSVSKMTGSSTPNGLKSDPRVMTAWARYISHFISAYENHGVSLWAITPQNEPEFPAPWEACSYNASFESYFVENYLGPIVKNDHPEIKILAFDHNKDHLFSWAQTMLFPTLPTKKSDYVDGMAFHWYSGNDRLLDGTYGYESVNATYHLAPDKILMATEGCSCPGVEINSWLRAERLGHDLLYDLNNYAQGWIDWNLLVDSKGGPNHLNNYCDSPIVAREDYSHFHLQPKYYYMGHFSKFIPSQSKRILVNVFGNFKYKQIHPVLHSGLEAGLYPCELSAKQMWKWESSRSGNSSSGGFLRLLMSGTNEIEAKRDSSKTAGDTTDESNLIEFCLSRGDLQRDYLTIWECPPVAAKSDDPRVQRSISLNLIPFQSDKSSYQYVQLKATGAPISVSNEEATSTSPSPSPSQCVTRSPSGLLQLKSCSSQDLNQQWVYHTNTGEIRSYQSSQKNYCLTAGWPYLSSSGYLTPSNQIVIVIMNEAPVDTYVTLKDSSTKTAMRVAIHSHSIETIIFHRNKKNLL